MISQGNILSCVKREVSVDDLNEDEVLSACEASLTKATSLIAARTFGRSKDATMSELYRAELDSAIEELGTFIASQTLIRRQIADEGQTKKSESVGGYSVTYETDGDKLLLSDEDFETRELKIIDKWLEPTDLMYRGASGT